MSKKHSAWEATTNMAFGFVISWVVWVIVVGPMIAAGVLSASNSVDAFLITMIFTVTSWLRSYFFRRIFHKHVTGVDK